MSRILGVLAVIGCGLALHPAPAAAQFSADRIFGYYDRDRDGKLDDDEIERLRGPLRDRLQGRREVSRDEFIRLSEEQQRDGDRGRSDRGGDGNRSSGQSGPKPRERVTIELPSKYTEGDRDGDGQVGLYEWIQWKSRVSIPEFLALDRNRDGFLTPYELTIAEKSNGSEAGGNGSSAGSTPGARPGSAPAGGPRPRLDEATVQIAREAFQNLAGEDGKISEEEWQNSRATRSRFEDAGVELKLPADLDTFLSLYPAEQSSAPAGGGDSTGSDGQSRERGSGGDGESRFRGRGFSRGGR